MGLWAYLIRRGVGLAAVLFGLSLVIFAIARLLPGDPARIALGPLATGEQVAALRQQMGLDRPAPVQYLTYMAGVLRGDFGQSLLTRRPVSLDIAETLPATIELVLVTVLVIVALALPLGMLGALKHGTWLDRGGWLFALLGAAIPSFVLAILLQLLAGHYWQFLPLGGRLSPDIEFTANITGFVLVDAMLRLRPDVFANGLAHLILPSLSLAVAAAAQLSRITQSSLLAAGRAESIETLRAFGVGARTIQYKYMLRAAVGAPLTILGLQMASLLGDAFVVETVFGWPGIASYGVRAILSKDFNAIMAVVLVFGLGFVIANLVIDLVIGLVDPRLGHAGAAR
jgi:peptide/nickel transport system permease protein